VFVHDAATIRKKDDVAAIEAFVKRPAPDATLFLLSEETRADSKLEKILPSGAKKVFWELFDNQKRGWITSYFRKQSVTIDPEAIDLFLELVENNTQELRSEADKLVIFAGSAGHIDQEAVEANIYHSHQENVFSLHRRVVDQDLTGALATLEKMVSSGEAEPVALIGGLLFQVRRLLSLRALLDHGASLDEAFRKLNIRGKRIQSDYREAASRYSAAELERQIKLLVEYDVAFREAGQPLSRLLLELLVYQLLFKTEALAVTANARSLMYE
jgi:DNA polymerase-3 subunit delta